MIEVNWCHPPYIFESANSSTECSGNFGYLRLIMNFRRFRGHKSIRKNRLTTWKELKAAKIKSNIILDQNRETFACFDPLKLSRAYFSQKMDQKLVSMAVSDTQFSHSCTKRSTDQSILQNRKNLILGLIKIIKTQTKSDRAVHWPISVWVPACTFTNLSDKAILPSPLSHVIEFKFNILWFFYVWTHPFNRRESFSKMCDFLFKQSLPAGISEISHGRPWTGYG